MPRPTGSRRPSAAWPPGRWPALAIGFTVVAGAFAVGGISGGVFNPQVAIGGATAGVFAWSTIWVYVLVELGAGVAAGLAFLTLNPGDK
jgi:aquaporin Z